MENSQRECIRGRFSDWVGDVNQGRSSKEGVLEQVELEDLLSYATTCMH